MFTYFKQGAGHRTGGALAAFTLAELMIALGVFVLVSAGLINGYIQSNRMAEWNAMSLAAQGYASQGVEQARSATWSLSAGDELPAPTNYLQTNAMQIPISGQTFYVSNIISISNLPTAYQLRQIRSDCYWQFPSTNGQWFTNTVVTERAPDQ